MQCPNDAGRPDLLRNSMKKHNLVRYAIVYLVVLVNEITWDLFTYYFPKYRVTFRRGGLSLFHLGRHFPPTGAVDRQVATYCQMFVRVYEIR